MNDFWGNYRKNFNLVLTKFEYVVVSPEQVQIHSGTPVVKKILKIGHCLNFLTSSFFKFRCHLHMGIP